MRFAVARRVDRCATGVTQNASGLLAIRRDSNPSVRIRHAGGVTHATVANDARTDVIVVIRVNV